MAEKMVAVPQRMLAELEIARKKIYAMHETEEPMPAPLLSKLVDITEPMWKLANTKWKEAK